MSDSFGLLFMYTEEPLHAGTGQGLGAIDLPIQRDVHTQFPVVYGSGLKGAHRHSLNGSDASALYGSAPGETETVPGSLSPHDAQVILFPVQSLKGGFAWITCPAAMARLLRNLERAGKPPAGESKWAPPKVGAGCCQLTGSPAIQHNGKIVLRDFTLSVETPETDQATAFAKWLVEKAMPGDDAYSYWRDELLKRLAILNDEDFAFFTLTATEIYTRVQLTHKKTVKTGALWTEEALPPETLLYAPVAARDASKLDEAKTKTPDNATLVIGGTETIGRGRVCLRWLGG